jgi:hypothetical protein
MKESWHRLADSSKMSIKIWQARSEARLAGEDSHEENHAKK